MRESQMKTGFCLPVGLLLLVPADPASAEPFGEAPQGYTLVAEDDCGSFENMPHVVRGTEYVFPTSMVQSSPEYRDIVFDNSFCLLRYNGLNPEAAYKVDVVYVTQAGAVRIQRLEAGGQVVHGDMPLPETTPGRFLFDIPRAAYADRGALELNIFNLQGA